MMEFEIGLITQHKHFGGPALLVVGLEVFRASDEQEASLQYVVCRYVVDRIFYEHKFRPFELYTAKEVSEKPKGAGFVLS